jgi:hypothetical protein
MIAFGSVPANEAAKRFDRRDFRVCFSRFLRLTARLVSLGDYLIVNGMLAWPNFFPLTHSMVSSSR